MKYSLILLVLGVWCTASNAEVKSYDGFKVFRMNPKTQEQKDILRTLEDGENELQFWTRSYSANIPIDVMVPPKNQEKFLTLMKNNMIETEVFIDDLQDRIAKQGVADSMSRAGLNWTSYFRLNDIYDWVDSLPGLYPGKVTVMKIGESTEKREIKGMKISFNTGKRGVFIEGGMHACEWISHATVTYIINELLTSTDPAFRKIAESFDWYIVPVSNPDGYEYSHTSDRLWRKTRSPQSEDCVGVDPNRNWDFHWGEQGASTSACTQTFAGPTPFSEPEMKYLSEFIASVGSELDVYISFHSYSQLLLVPNGYTDEHLSNYDDVVQIGKASISALAKRYGTEYKVGNTAEMLYKASGIVTDWVKDTFNIPIVFTYELRDIGNFGFVLPATEILPNCLETIDCLVAMFQESEKLEYFTLG